MNAIVHDCAGVRLKCGPSVIASITGQPTSVIIPAERALYSDFPGTPFWVIARLCLDYGYRFEANPYRGTLAGLDSRLHISVVDAGRGHYVLTENGFLVDSCNLVPKPIFNTRFLREPVRECWSVVPL